MNNLKEFLNTLEVDRHTFLTVVGGGGKTSLLFFLSERCGFPSAVTTTTKMRTPQSSESLDVLIGRSEAQLKEALASDAHCVFLAREALPDGKVAGYSGGFLGELFDFAQNRVFLCEGDGSKGLPFKFHAPYEPVIPECTQTVVLVVGAEALEEKMASNLVHRLPKNLEGSILSADFFREYCKKFTEEKMAGSFKKVLFINKVDGEEKLEKKALSFGEVASPYFDSVYIGSLKNGWVIKC